MDIAQNYSLCRYLSYEVKQAASTDTECKEYAEKLAEELGAAGNVTKVYSEHNSGHEWYEIHYKDQAIRVYRSEQVADDIQTQLEFGFASEKDIFYEDALNYVKDILKAQDEIIEEHKDDEEEFKLENYLIDYDFDTDTFTLYLTYDITEELFKEIQDNMIKENEEDNITLPESIIEIMEFNFDDIQYVEHIELTLQHDEDIEFCVVDLITNEIISLDGKPYDE